MSFNISPKYASKLIGIAMPFVGAVFLYRIFSINFLVGWPDNRIDDLMNYLTGASILTQGLGDKLYDVSTQFEAQRMLAAKPEYVERLLPFRTIPVAAAIYIPFLFLSMDQAIGLFSLINMGILLTCFYFLKKYFYNSIIVGFLLISFHAVFMTFITGQPSLLLFLFLVFAWSAFKKSKYLVCGLFVGMLALKLNLLVPAALGFLVLVGNNYKKYLSGLTISLVLIYVVSVLLSGPEFLLNMIKFVTSTESEKFCSPAYYYSIGSFLTNFFKLGLPIALFVNYILLCCFAAVIFLRKKYLSDEKLFALVSLSIPAFAFHVYISDVVFVVPLLTYVLKTYVFVDKPKLLNQIFFLIIFTIPLILQIYYLDQSTLLSAIYITVPLLALLLV